MNPNKKFVKSRSLLYGTILILVAAFVLMIILFVGFAAFLPNLMGRCVAVVNIDAPITTEGVPTSLFSEGYPGSEDQAALLRSLDGRADVGAVVIVFNSPGGSVVATREVYQAVEEIDKPTVSYFREMAASGAYYIASGTDYIVSEPNAITGSIGVIATFADMSGLLDQLGVNITSVKSGDLKDIGTFDRPMSEKEYNITMALVEEVFAEFKQVVNENRAGKLDPVLFDQVLDGRILTGRQAQKVGLVDETGSKRDAIMKAADLANISYDSYEDIRVCPAEPYQREAGLFSAEALFHLLGQYSGTKVSYR